LTINQTLATKYFPGEDPIGKRIKLVGLETAPEPVADPWFEIVGVTSDIKNHGIRDAILPEVYAPFPFSSYGGYVVFLRTAVNPASITKAMDEQIWAVDRNIVPQQTSSLEDSLDLFEYAQPRFGLRLFTVFASIGLILVSVGVYSVISYTVSQQSHEIGIRMALGATSGDVRSQVLKDGLRFIFVGMGIGVVLAFIIARALASQFWGVSPYDPATLASVVIVLSLVGLAACFVPSQRATRVDPAISLRYD
jgi:putative ABC transport system permease protein